MDRKNHTPPKLAEKLLRQFLKPDFLEDVLGDLEENFYFVLRNRSSSVAWFTYWYQTFNYLRPFALKKSKSKTINQFTMLRHHVKVSWRTLLRQKVFSSIEIGGFAVGIAACILIALYIGHQVNYDRHYEHKDQIFRVVNQWSERGEVGYWSNVHGPLKEVLEDNIPEMEQVARIVLWSWGDAGENHLRKIESKYNRYEEGFFYADPELLNILEIPMVYGMQEHALSDPNSMVISRRKADQYFPNENPVGRRIVLNDNPETIYTIGGVMENFPATSHLQGDFILTLYGRKDGPGTSGWCCTNYNMYVKLVAQANRIAVEQKTVELRNSFVIERLREDGQSGLDDIQKYQSYYLQPVENIHLNPEEVGDDLSHGSVDLVWIFGFIAVIILLLACINFVNLATSKSLKRAKEVGLRKVVGSSQTSLIYQYLSESCVYSLLAILLGVFLAWSALPFFNQLAGASLSIPWLSVWFIPLLLISALLIGVLSGIYPAFYLSRFRPIEALKGQADGGARNSLLRSGMVVFQFTATVILIIGALVTHQQFQFLMNKSLGYEKDQVINILGINTMEGSMREALKEELLKLSMVESASLSDYLPVEGSFVQNRSFWIADRRQLDNGFEAARWAVDEDYITTMKMKISQGRNFISGSADDSSIIINESMVRELGLEEPVGTRIVDMFDLEYHIVGVVKDFYFESLYQNVRPLAMVLGKGRTTLSVKINSPDIQATMASIGEVWEKFNTHQAIRYSFMDQRFEKMYEGLQQAKTIFLLFAMLSILVACLGLFALSIYMVEQRGKEISVRKVLGASMGRIFKLLTFDFVKLVLIAIVLAVPVAWYFMDYFLSDMVNRIELSWQVFAFGGVVAIVIAVGTISFESIKAAIINPAKKLRSE